mmetsp:Transcript_35168/g.87589  ORF Transcript_35168/g.87589 Transcript_35168/m.87589 type:complete len:290 (+) Transcript_35168:381-1250(+)
MLDARAHRRPQPRDESLRRRRAPDGCRRVGRAAGRRGREGCARRGGGERQGAGARAGVRERRDEQVGRGGVAGGHDGARAAADAADTAQGAAGGGRQGQADGDAQVSRRGEGGADEQGAPAGQGVDAPPGAYGEPRHAVQRAGGVLDRAVHRPSARGRRAEPAAGADHTHRCAAAAQPVQRDQPQGELTRRVHPHSRRADSTRADAYARSRRDRPCHPRYCSTCKGGNGRQPCDYVLYVDGSNASPAPRTPRPWPRTLMLRTRDTCTFNKTSWRLTTKYSGYLIPHIYK